MLIPSSGVADGAKELRARVWILPLLFAALSCLVIRNHFGIDYEEVPTIAYSVGSPASRLAPPLNTDAGLYRLIGSPLYDFRQGLGTRIPTQGNWALSPSVYLGEFLDIKAFTLLHVFVSTFAMSFAGSLCLWTYRVRQQMLRQIVFMAVALGFVFVFAKHTDWSTVIRVNASIVTVVCVLLIKLRGNRSCRFGRDDVSRLPPPLVTRLLATCGLGDLIFQHPGALPMASVIIGSCLAAVYWESDVTPNKKGFTIGYQAWVAISVVLLNIAIIYFDFKSGLSGDFRSKALGGLGVPNFLDGILGDKFPPEIELGASILVANTVLPLFLVPGLEMFPNNYRLQIISESLPRSSFALFGAAIVIAVWLRRRRSPSLRSLQRTILFTFASTILYLAVQQFQVLPGELSMTTAWVQTHSLRIILCIALLITTGSVPFRKSRILSLSANFNLALAALYSAIVIAPNIWGAAPLKNVDSLPFAESNVGAISRIFRDDGNYRFAVVQGASNADSKLDSIRFVDIASTGTPLVFPVWTKARSTEPLFENDVGIGRHEVTLETLASQLSVDHNRFWDFLNVRTLIVPLTSAPRTDLVRLVTPGFVQVSQQPEAKRSFEILRRRGFATFYRREDSPEYQSGCTIIGGVCENLLNSAKGPVIDEPRLRMCSHGCVASFRYDVPPDSGRAWILLPLRYDQVLQVTDSMSSTDLETKNAGGLLEVGLLAGFNTGSLEIRVQPDLTMILRSAMPVINLLTVVVMILPSHNERKRKIPRGRIYYRR